MPEKLKYVTLTDVALPLHHTLSAFEKSAHTCLLPLQLSCYLFCMLNHFWLSCDAGGVLWCLDVDFRMFFFLLLCTFAVRLLLLFDRGLPDDPNGRLHQMKT